MNALIAIFTRALREHTRSKPLAIVRGGFAAMVVWVLVMQRVGKPVAPGLQFLYGIILLNLIFIVLAATSYFSTSITEEKEEGTLALLRMANVSPTGLLLAKSGTRVIEGVLLLAVQLPFGLLAVSLGGVMWEQIVAAYITLAAFTFLAGNLALLASVLSARSVSASLSTAAMLALIIFGGWLLSYVGLTAFGAMLGALNPFLRLTEVTSLTFGGSLAGPQFHYSIYLGAGAFLASRILFDRTGNEAPAGLGWTQYFTSTARDRLRAPRPVPRMAVEWKDFHFLYGGNRLIRWKTRLYFIFAIIALMPAGIRFLNGQPANLAFAGAAVAGIGIVGIVLETAYAASRMFGSERDAKSLAALVLTPHLYPETLFAVKERIAKAAIIPAKWIAIIGMVVSLGGTIGLNMNFLLPSLIGVLFTWSLMLPLWWVFEEFLRQIVIHFSLRYSWGSMAAGIAVWLVASLFIATVLTAVASVIGAYLSLIPAWYCSYRLRKRNLLLLTELAAAEQ